MIFSEKLQLIRRNKGMTQEELAQRLSVSRQAVAKWEAGQAYGISPIARRITPES